MKILTTEQMKRLDEYAIRNLKMPGVVLMENAGRSVVEAISGICKKKRGKKVLIVCGRGNNGGDGFVIARHLANSGARVKTVLIGKAEGLEGDALTNYEVYKNYGGDVFEITDRYQLGNKCFKEDFDLIVDAIFGTGLAKKVRGIYSNLIDFINNSAAKVVSVDIPSGLDANRGFPLGKAVKADVTVTFGYPKLGLLVGKAFDYVGDLVTKDISLPKKIPPDSYVNLIEPGLVKSLFKPRRRDSHKGTHGHVAVFAGSKEKSGAAKLAAISCLRGGAGLVTLIVPKSAHDVIKSSLFNVMSLGVDDDGRGNITEKALKRIIGFAKDMDVVAVGPGLVRGPLVGKLIVKLIKRDKTPLVVDADGLNSLAGRMHELGKGRENVVFTPHPGEMARLIKKKTSAIQEDRVGVARGFASKYGVTVVLKGFRSVVAFPDGSVYINPTGNPSMATAGMGDVLCGLIASCLAQQRDFKKGVLSAVFNHGLLGDLVACEFGERGVTATDLVNKLTVINRTLYPATKPAKVEEI